MLVDRGREFTGWTFVAVRTEVLPEERVEDVTRKVERERLLQTDDRAEIARRACAGESFERRVDTVDVRLVMFAVVQFERAG